MPNWQIDPAHGKSGNATMGMFHNGGTVFTAATTDWVNGLKGSWGAVAQITQNALRRLSCSCPSEINIKNRSFEKWMNASTPESWTVSGRGYVRKNHTAIRTGRFSLEMASRRESGLANLLRDLSDRIFRSRSAIGVRVSQGPLNLESHNYYRVSCWALSENRGVSIRLQTTLTERDFAVAEYSGSGGWEYLCAVGMIGDEEPLVEAEVIIQALYNVTAIIDYVSVDLGSVSARKAPPASFTTITRRKRFPASV